MATSLLALIDDIATVLDDVAILSKVAARKTAAVLGDDLALNAQQVTGVRAERELPVVWAVFKGSLVNKADPGAGGAADQRRRALGHHAAADGGGCICASRASRSWPTSILHDADAEQAHQGELAAALADPKVDLAALERRKVKGAIRTDFILSAEIVVITLGTVAAGRFATPSWCWPGSRWR
jgi:predicted DNA repair protein MutK